MTSKEPTSSIQIPSAPGIGEHVYQSEGLFRRYGHLVSAYDPSTQCGGVYHLAWREWCVWYPIDAEDFAARVARAVAIAEAADKCSADVAKH